MNTERETDTSLKKNPKQIAAVAAGVLVIGLLAYLGTRVEGPHHAATAAGTGTGSEMPGLSESDALAPNDDEVQIVECVPKNPLREGEFIFGKQGAFIRVSADGKMTPSTGVELAALGQAPPLANPNSAPDEAAPLGTPIQVFDPENQDASLSVQVQCTVDPDEGDGEPSAFVNGLRPTQFFSTKKGAKINAKVSAMEQNFYQTQINTSCIDQTSTQSNRMDQTKPPCVRPKLIAITDLNNDGKREFWAVEPYMFETGLGVIEEPDNRILSACPDCPH